jgi:hypothetical protein
MHTKPIKLCSVSNCGNPSRAGGKCTRHYQADWRLAKRPPRVRQRFIDARAPIGLPVGFRSEHIAWANMLQRCYNEKHPQFKNYGARGIVVCARWRASFAAFLEDMGPKPSRELSIDRENNDGSYSPQNCRWATAKQQSANQRPRSPRRRRSDRISIS